MQQPTFNPCAESPWIRSKPISSMRSAFKIHGQWWTFKTLFQLKGCQQQQQQQQQQEGQRILRNCPAQASATKSTQQLMDIQQNHINLQKEARWGNNDSSIANKHHSQFDSSSRMKNCTQPKERYCRLCRGVRKKDFWHGNFKTSNVTKRDKTWLHATSSVTSHVCKDIKDVTQTCL